MSMQNQIAQRGARLVRAGEDRVDVAAGARGRGGGEHDATEAAARGLGVDDLDPAVAAALVEQRLGLRRGADRARDPAGQVDRDDVAAGREQRLVGGDEVADRRLRGRRQRRRRRAAARRRRRSR